MSTSAPVTCLAASSASDALSDGAAGAPKMLLPAKRGGWAGGQPVIADAIRWPRCSWGTSAQIQLCGTPEEASDEALGEACTLRAASSTGAAGGRDSGS